MTPLLGEWEDELGRVTADRLRRRARMCLATREWEVADLEDAIEAAERRLTPLQREHLWSALTHDPDLSAILRGALS